MMIGSLPAPSITNATSTFPSLTDSASVRTHAIDVVNPQSATAVGGLAQQDAAGRSPSSSTTQNVIFDPTLLEMIYEELGARTDQMLGQVPMRSAATGATYPQNRARQARHHESMPLSDVCTVGYGWWNTAPSALEAKSRPLGRSLKAMVINACGAQNRRSLRRITDSDWGRLCPKKSYELHQKAKQLRQRAEELRTNADNIQTEECRRISFVFVEMAEQLADNGSILRRHGLPFGCVIDHV
jgi:hypothetical protein